MTESELISEIEKLESDYQNAVDCGSENILSIWDEWLKAIAHLKAFRENHS